MAAGYNTSGGESEPYGSWNQDLDTDIVYSETALTLAPMVLRQLERFQVMFPGESTDAIRCLMAVCCLVLRGNLPYCPRLAYAVQCGHSLAVNQHHQLLPIGEQLLGYRHVQCVEVCLEGVKDYLMSVECWEACEGVCVSPNAKAATKLSRLNHILQDWRATRLCPS